MKLFHYSSSMHSRGHWLLGLGVSTALGVFAACGNSNDGSNFVNSTDAGGGTDAQSFPETGGFGGDGATSCNPCSDFPATPILDPASGPDAGGPAVTAAPPNSAT
ncbi:MAG: hypothetical protein ABI551_14790, partial [Polyangiaceae bacterium]